MVYSRGKVHCGPRESFENEKVKPLGFPVISERAAPEKQIQVHPSSLKGIG